MTRFQTQMTLHPGKAGRRRTSLSERRAGLTNGFFLSRLVGGGCQAVGKPSRGLYTPIGKKKMTQFPPEALSK